MLVFGVIQVPSIGFNYVSNDILHHSTTVFVSVANLKLATLRLLSPIHWQPMNASS